MVAAQDISPAEKLLFLTNHMGGLHEPVALTYSYRKEGSAEPGFADEVHLDVTKINPDKSATVSMRFLSGERKLNMPEIGDANGNPALLAFLERDIAEMRRRTGGSVNYFRKRIRLALANAKELRPVPFTYQGMQKEGKEVRIQPYINDPMRERFRKYINKTYVFIISSEVPGGLYQVRTSVDGSIDKKGRTLKEKPGIVETLTLEKDQRLGSAPGKGGK
jgi:hypothetical protein